MLINPSPPSASPHSLRGSQGLTLCPLCEIYRRDTEVFEEPPEEEAKKEKKGSGKKKKGSKKGSKKKKKKK